MWARLQLRCFMRLKCGLVLALLHSIWVLGLGYAGYRNHDLQFAWAAQERLDFPIGLLAEPVRSFFLISIDGQPVMTFNSANIAFFLTVGGFQFFIWGYLIGAFSSLALRERRRLVKTKEKEKGSVLTIDNDDGE